MPLFRALLQNSADIRAFGIRYALRHIARLSGKRTTNVRIPGVGEITIRPADSDASVLRQVFRDQEYSIASPPELESRIQLKYRDILARGKRPVIIDAGANIGAASRWFAQVYPEAHVVAVEPDPANAELLKANTAGMPMINIEEAAIGSERGFVSLVPAEASWGTRTLPSNDGIRVVTINELNRQIPDGELFIVKIDIEGYEAELFKKNTEWIGDASLIYVEPHDWMLPGQGSSRTFQNAMATHDFELFIRGENLIYARMH